jgi:ketosteroid isomerase-like protein
MSTATATTSTSVDLIRSTFEAFGRGDIAYILANLTPDCTWICPGELPYSGAYTGPAGAGEFFQKLGATEQITVFEPREYFTSGDDVMVLGYEEGRSIATGKTVTSHWAMLFRVRNGKVSHWQTHFDTAAYARAHQA